MTIEIDIPEADLALLDQLSEKESVPREELVRKSIATYLEPHRKRPISEFFGAWVKNGRPYEDGLAFEDRIRSEWEIKTPLRHKHTH